MFGTGPGDGRLLATFDGRFEGDEEEATPGEWFPPFRLFDEAVEAVDFTRFELGMESVLGPRTVA